MSRLGVFALAIGLTAGCASTPATPPPPPSTELVTADPQPIEPDPPELAPSSEDSPDDPSLVWWTPLAPISLDELSHADKGAVTDCVQQHRVTEADATADELYAGAVCLGAHRAFGREIRVFTHLLQQYPDAPQVPEVLVAVGQRYEQIDMRSKAVDAYRMLLAKYPKRDETQAMAKRAVCLARSLGDAATVEDLLARLHRLYGRKGFVVPPDIAFEQLCVRLPPLRR